MTRTPATEVRPANPMTATGAIFDERQRMSEPLIVGILVGVIVIMLCIAAYILLAQFVLTQLPLGAPMSDGKAIGLALTFAATAFVTWALAAIVQMLTRIDSTEVLINYRPIYRKHIPIDTIQSWEVCTYHPIGEYGGWGIRLAWSMKSWCYTIAGHRGVMLTLAGGRRILVGSQRPEEFAAALEKAKGGAAV